MEVVNPVAQKKQDPSNWAQAVACIAHPQTVVVATLVTLLVTLVGVCQYVPLARWVVLGFVAGAGGFTFGMLTACRMHPTTTGFTSTKKPTGDLSRACGQCIEELLEWLGFVVLSGISAGLVGAILSGALAIVLPGVGGNANLLVGFNIFLFAASAVRNNLKMKDSFNTQWTGWNGDSVVGGMPALV